MEKASISVSFFVMSPDQKSCMLFVCSCKIPGLLILCWYSHLYCFFPLVIILQGSWNSAQTLTCPCDWYQVEEVTGMVYNPLTQKWSLSPRNTSVNYIAYGVNRSGSVWARFTNCVNWCTLDKFTWELLYFNFAKLSTTFSASKCMAISWCSLSFEHYLLLPELSILIKVIRMNECYQNIFLGLVPRLALL